MTEGSPVASVPVQLLTLEASLGSLSMQPSLPPAATTEHPLAEGGLPRYPGRGNMVDGMGLKTVALARPQDREIVLGAIALRRAAAALATIATEEDLDDVSGDLRRLSHWLGLVARQDGCCYLRTYP